MDGGGGGAVRYGEDFGVVGHRELPVPKGCDHHAIARNISSALAKLDYCGPVSISSYGDTTRISSAVQQALSSTGIALKHIHAAIS